MTFYANASIFRLGFCLQDPDSENRLPFANSANPVMALVGDFVES